MLNETNGATTAAAARNVNGDATAMHLLASGPLFGNLGSVGAAVPSTPPTLPPFSTPPTAGVDHLAQNSTAAAAAAAAATMAPHNQMLAALAAVSASRNAAAAMPQQQPHHPQHVEALQALLAHAAAASNGLPPFGIYQPPGMRPGMVGPMPPNFLFDGVGAAAGYHPYAMENGRRKNATREVTQPLKVWLEQHHKNPYPTKAEKTVLAIITKMNLTQVSTWFANARRRLKKDNKMTWSPRNNRNADDEDVGSERPSGSPLSTLSDSDAQRDSFENSENGNPNCTNASHWSDAFLFGNNKHLSQQQQRQKIDGEKKIWSIEGTLSAPQQSPAKLAPSAYSSTDILKTESKVDLSSSSDSPARALAAMTAAFMAQQRATAAKTSPPTAEDAGQDDLKSTAGLSFGMNPTAVAALNSSAQQQQNVNQQPQQMFMNPLFAFLSQNQRQLQSQQQQQNILFMVAAAAAAAAAKNPPQQQQQNLFNLYQQQQQQQMQRHGGLESFEGRSSECGANSASASPASCSASSPAPNLAIVCNANGICEPFEERSRTSSAELAPAPSVGRLPTCLDDVDSKAFAANFAFTEAGKLSGVRSPLSKMSAQVEIKHAEKRLNDENNWSNGIHTLKERPLFNLDTTIDDNVSEISNGTTRKSSLRCRSEKTQQSDENRTFIKHGQKRSLHFIDKQAVNDKVKITL